MIHVCLHMAPAYLERAKALIDAAELLRDLDVRLSLGLDAKADVQIIQSQLFEQLEAEGDARLKPPYVIWERADQETVRQLNRHLIQRDDVVGWLKDHLSRDPALNNAPHVAGYYHFGLMGRDSEAFPAVPIIPPLGQAELDKITSLQSLATMARFERWRTAAPLGMEHRNIDVSFIGTTSYPDAPPLHLHRRRGAQEVTQLDPHRAFVAVGAFLSADGYFDAISRSRIFVSPYGYSMSSWKDWEALFAGCVLLKPDSWLQQNYHADIFGDRANFVACKGDFSDLRERVEEILDNYPAYHENSLRVREAMLAAKDLTPVALDLHRLAHHWAAQTSNFDYGVVGGVVSDAGRARRAAARRMPEDWAVTAAPEGDDLLAGAPLDARPWWAVRADLSSMSGAGPEGETAYHLVDAAAVDNTHDVRCSLRASTGGRAVAFSLACRPDQAQSLWVWIGNDSFEVRAEAQFGVASGRVGQTAAFGGAQDVRAGMSPLADGWWRCWITAELTSGTGLQVLVGMGGPNGEAAYTTAGGRSIWLAQPKLTFHVLPALAAPAEG